MNTAIKRNMSIQKVKNAIKNKTSFYIVNIMNWSSPSQFPKFHCSFLRLLHMFEDHCFPTIAFPIYITQCKYELFNKYFQSLVCNWTGECFCFSQTLFSEGIYCFLGPVEQLVFQ